MKNKFFAVTFALGLTVSAVVAADQKRIYIANDDHTDYMWTADAETYANVFVDFLDYYMKLADETATNPPAYQSRFNPDGSFWLWTYERKKSAADFDRLMANIKSGHINAPLNALVVCYGAQPTEAVLRGMYYAGRLERRYDVRFPIAVAMENQTLPLGLASLWSGSGALYSWKGVCACVSKLPTSVLKNRDHEIYWYTGLDGHRVLMKWYSVDGYIGTYLEASGPFGAVKHLASDTNFLNRYRDPATGQPYLVRGAFGLGGDCLEEKTGVPADPGIPGEPGVKRVPGYSYVEHFHNVARMMSTPELQVFASNQKDFFEDFETNYGASLPAENVTHGNEWDLYSASMVETSARVRRAVEKLRPAELMSALVSLKRPGFMRDRLASRDLAFMDLGLYWEHDWTADGPVSRASRAAWEESLAAEIETYVNSLHADAMLRLGGLIQKPDENAQRFFVLNPLGWPRTDYADFDYRGGKDIHVRDVTTGHDVPHQFISLNGLPSLRILASDVPSAGYKTFEILNGSGAAPTNAAASVSSGNTTLENARVKVVVDPDGAIASLIDKSQPDTELAATIDGLKLNDFAANDTSGNAIVLENSGPVSVTLKCVSDAGRAHTTRVTLFRDSDRVEIRNEITENFADVRHWAFSFNLANPDVHTEELGSIIHDKKKSDGGNYADTHARYDYATLNHFADITDGSNTRGVTLANADCAFVKLGHSISDKLDTATPQLNVLAGGQVDGSWLGIRGQNGATWFLQRFALHPHGAYDQVAAMKFALEHQNPLVAGAIIGLTNSPYPAANYSLLKVSNPSVLLWALKPHDDGVEHGLVARLWNLSDNTARAELSLTPDLTEAHRTTHIETDIETVPLTDTGLLPTSFARQQLQTYRLTLK